MPYTPRVRRSPAPSAAALLLLSACAHAPVPDGPVRLPVDFLRPRVEEATRQAALLCAGKEPDRVVEIEVGLEGVARGRVLPYDPSGGEATACVEQFTRPLPRQPPEQVVRALYRGDGAPLDPRSPRGRALTLRSRVAEQAEPVQRCAAEWSARHPSAKGRISLHTVISGEGAVVLAQINASSLDELADRCVQDALRGMRMARMAADYRFSFLFLGEVAFLGAPDVDPVDVGELAQAVDRIRADLQPCFGAYRTPGDVIIQVVLDNDGRASEVAVEHAVVAPAVEKDDLAADGCVRTVARTLRVLPFDGPRVSRRIPFKLR